MPEGQKAGPKGRTLEVGVQQASRLLVFKVLFNYCYRQDFVLDKDPFGLKVLAQM